MQNVLHPSTVSAAFLLMADLDSSAPGPIGKGSLGPSLSDGECLADVIRYIQDAGMVLGTVRASYRLPTRHPTVGSPAPSIPKILRQVPPTYPIHPPGHGHAGQC